MTQQSNQPQKPVVKAEKDDLAYFEGNVDDVNIEDVQFSAGYIPDSLPSQGCDTEKYVYLWVPKNVDQIPINQRTLLDSRVCQRVSKKNHPKIDDRSFMGREFLELHEIALWYCKREVYKAFVASNFAQRGTSWEKVNNLEGSVSDPAARGGRKIKYGGDELTLEGSTVSREPDLTITTTNE